MGIFKKFKQNYMDNGFVIEMEKPIETWLEKMIIDFKLSGEVTDTFSNSFWSQFKLSEWDVLIYFQLDEILIKSDKEKNIFKSHKPTVYEIIMRDEGMSKRTKTLLFSMVAQFLYSFSKETGISKIGQLKDKDEYIKLLKQL